MSVELSKQDWFFGGKMAKKFLDIFFCELDRLTRLSDFLGTLMDFYANLVNYGRMNVCL